MLRISRLAARTALSLRARSAPGVACTRQLSSTRSALAAEDPSPFMARFRHSPLFKQLADKPEALSALSDIAALIKNKGWNISTSEPPSPVALMRMIGDKEFRAAATRVMDELRKAGIDFKPENALELLTGQSPKDDGSDKKS